MLPSSSSSSSNITLPIIQSRFETANNLTGVRSARTSLLGDLAKGGLLRDLGPLLMGTHDIKGVRSIFITLCEMVRTEEEAHGIVYHFNPDDYQRSDCSSSSNLTQTLKTAEDYQLANLVSSHPDPKHRAEIIKTARTSQHDWVEAHCWARIPKNEHPKIKKELLGDGLQEPKRPAADNSGLGTLLGEDPSDNHATAILSMPVTAPSAKKADTEADTDFRTLLGEDPSDNHAIAFLSMPVTAPSAKKADTEADTEADICCNLQ
jgi:hypothetical protein